MGMLTYCAAKHLLLSLPGTLSVNSLRPTELHCHVVSVRHVARLCCTPLANCGVHRCIVLMLASAVGHDVEHPSAYARAALAPARDDGAAPARAFARTLKARSLSCPIFIRSMFSRPCGMACTDWRVARRMPHRHVVSYRWCSTAYCMLMPTVHGRLIASAT